MVALLFEASSGRSLDVTPVEKNSKITFLELEKMIGGSISIMFSDFFENQIIVMNNRVYDSEAGLPRNAEISECFQREMYGNVLICEEKYLPIETWETHFVTAQNVIYHTFGRVVVSFNCNTHERCLIKDGVCIDSFVCGDNYLIDQHYSYLAKICVDVAKMNSFRV